MAIRQRRDKRREALSDDGENWLRCKPSGFFEFQPGDVLDATWETHSERVVAEHVEEFPGTRPERWWEYEAPERFRLRSGGIGTPECEVLNIKPAYSFGIPVGWIDQWQVDYHTGIAVDIHGRLVNEKAIRSGFKGVAIDPDDAPTFESQPTFLERHDLFLPGERKRLGKPDFEAESVCS